MDSLYRLLIRLRVPVLLAALAVTVWLGSYLGDVKFDTSTNGSVPRGDEAQRFYEEAIDTFGNDVVSVAVVVADGPLGVFTPAALRKISDLTRTIEGFEGVQEVVSLTNAVYLRGAEMLETAPVVPDIPADAAAAARLRTSVLGNALFHKTLVSVDGSAAAINVFVRDLPDEQLLALDIDGKIRRLLAAAGGPEQLYYAGLSNTRRIINETMRHDIVRLGPLALLLIAVILALSFRSPIGVLLPLLNVVMAVIWTVGLIGLTGRAISLVSSMLPPLLVAVGSAYAIHLVAVFTGLRARAGDSRQAAFQTLQSVAWPVAMTAFTTVAGFAALTLNRIPNIRTMGLFAAVGIVCSALIALTVVPALLSFVRAAPVRRRARRSRFDAVLDGIGQMAGGRAALVIVATGTLLLAAAIGLARVRADTDFLSFFRPSSEIRITTDLIAEHLAGASTFYVIIDGSEREAERRAAAAAGTRGGGGEPDEEDEPEAYESMTDVEVLRAIDGLQRFMETLPGVDKTNSLVDQLRLLNQALEDDDPAANRIPDQQGVMDDLFLLFSISLDPGALSRYINGDNSQISIFVRSDLVGSKEIRETLQTIQDYAADHLPAGVRARPTGTLVVLNNAMEAITKGQRNSLGMALAIVFLLMTALFRSLRAGLLAMVPNAVPILILFGMMGWSGITLNIGTSIIAAMALGIAVDDTVHYMVHFKRSIRDGADQRQATLHSLQEVGKPVVFTSLTLCLGFLIMAVSDFQIIRAVGILTGTTMITALACDLLLLPALLLVLPPVIAVHKPGPPADEVND